MIDIKFVIKGLEDAKDVIRKSEITGGKKVRLIDACCNAVTLLKEQEAEIRQLRLALDIAKGTCKGIVMKDGEVE